LAEQPHLSADWSSYQDAYDDRMKRIAVFCDGTWNSPVSKDHETNVFRLSTVVRSVASDGVQQIGQYHEGIGTSGSRLRRQFAGATGYGLSRNIRTAYRAVAEVFEPGDELFLFGFSRGAFTVRSLAGFIRNCGILKRDQLHRVDEAFALYRRRDAPSHPSNALATTYRAEHSVETRIKFIGVFDTVGALGNPLLLNGGWFSFSRNRFHDLKLSRSVDFAYHALAVDEKRRKFEAALWDEPSEQVPGQTVRQVWFAGVHSNVGGGYAPWPGAHTVASDNALQWMANAARGAGLDLDLPQLTPDPFARLNESRLGIYRLWRPFFRPVGTRGYSEPTAVVAGSQSLHESLLARYRATTSPLYRPRNLDDRVPQTDAEIAV
jgi:uncharacterized protein (DUF2235 family)